MTSSPQPLQVRRRGGAKRGDHGSYVAPEPAVAPTPEPPASAAPTATESAAATSNNAGRAATASARPTRRVGKSVSHAAAAAKAAYDAKPKVIIRGVDDEDYYKMRAIYKHQLRSPDGIEGWSEFGRDMIRKFVQDYEAEHGEMTGGENVELPAGRRMSQ